MAPAPNPDRKKSAPAPNLDRKKSTAIKKAPDPKAPEKPKRLNTTMENITEIDDDIDFGSLVRYEYNKLHRQYRLMENNRHLLSEEGKSIRQKEHLLDILQRQKMDMETKLHNAESEGFQQVDKRNISTILDIMEFCDKTNLDIKWCIKSIEELERNVNKITTVLVHQKLKVQAIFGQSLTVPQVDKRRNILEGRLYYFTTRFDTKVSQNKALREEINMLLVDRGLFHERVVTIKKLSSYLRATMGEYVYQATQVYENRDDYVRKITQLREKNEKDSKQHVSDIRDLNREVAYDIKLRSFTSFNNLSRNDFETVEQRNERINATKLKQMDQILQAHAKSFQALLTLSNHHSMASLMKDYNDKEQTNFAKFKYIIDLNDEVETIQNETINMGKEIEEIYKKSTNLDKEREKIIEAEINKYREHQDKLQSTKELDAKSKSDFNEIVQLLQGIYTVGECDKTSIASLLGNNRNEVNLKNAVISVKTIEKRIEDLLEQKKELEFRKAEESEKGPINYRQNKSGQGKALFGKRVNAGGPYIPKPLLMNTHVEGEDEEEDMPERSNLPLTYPELRVKIIDKLRRQAEAALKLSKISIITPTGHGQHGSTHGSPRQSTSRMSDVQFN